MKKAYFFLCGHLYTLALRQSRAPEKKRKRGSHVVFLSNIVCYDVWWWWIVKEKAICISLSQLIPSRLLHKDELFGVLFKFGRGTGLPHPVFYSLNKVQLLYLCLKLFFFFFFQITNGAYICYQIPPHNKSSKRKL